ncbi:sugar phosphate permease [Sphingobium sp. AEW010]|nr:MFS transporter [Sphingobium sp. AEW4]TWD00150.1 sugar phosphate permease [Sphingobium sp. AEW010]TWD19215.1 sugar phosphate permease [Sphingobium sp. AEW013]TWD22120.1 sugar phosphate permease [Sphingobium sp. AEW001]
MSAKSLCSSATTDMANHIPVPTAPTPSAITALRASLLVITLMLALALSFVDRQILALLIDPIKCELGLSDTRFGVLQGVAFALFYIGFGIPLGRQADRGNRRNLIIFGIIMWSVMTIACGTATSFVSLFAWRAGVGIGEAALSPAAYSMITDAVPKRRLSLALGVYNMGVYLGSGAALLAGGALLKWLSTMNLSGLPLASPHPWRMVFLCVGAPGLIMALLMSLLSEPARTHFDARADKAMPTVMETVRFIASERKLFAGLILGFACHNTSLYALLSWIPAFLGRHYYLAPADVGLMLGLSTMTGGGVGLVLGGLLSDRLFQSGRCDAPLIVAIVSAVGIAIGAAFTLSAGSPQAAAWAFGVTMVFVALPIGPASAALQLVVPNRYRGQVSAFYLVSISLAGLTIGPVAPPLISDHILHSPTRIGEALMLTICVVAILSIILFLAGRPAYARRYAAIHLSNKPCEGE